MATLLALFVLTYALASVPFSLVVTTLHGGEVDVRTAGSGNPGATNVARLYGWWVGGIVMALDILKGCLPVLLARALWPDLDPWLGGAVAVVAFLAHVFPIYLEFRGGKGVATGAGGMLALAPLPTLVAAGLWSLLLVLTGRSSVAAIGATLAMIGLTAWLSPFVLPLVVGLAAAIVVTHTPNLRRIWRGEEKAVVRPVRWSRAPSAGDASALDESPAGPMGAPPEAWPTLLSASPALPSAAEVMDV